jgi:hypothetical protein
MLTATNKNVRSKVSFFLKLILTIAVGAGRADLLVDDPPGSSTNNLLELAKECATFTKKNELENKESDAYRSAFAFVKNESKMLRLHVILWNLGVDFKSKQAAASSSSEPSSSSPPLAFAKLRTEEDDFKIPERSV